ncbi:MAG: hypothetical protein JO247_12465 [Chloroflexi bacterium]|nr:hypothetical protein [Chloroflexota bacterium]
MDWLDVHAGSVQAFATLVLVVITAYYAWVTRAQVRETRRTLQSTARMTLQDRLDRVMELFVSDPDLFDSLAAAESTGTERDRRWWVSNLLLAVLEEAYLQHYVDHTMPAQEWHAWEQTLDSVMGLQYVAGYWRNTGRGFNESFASFLDARLDLGSGSPLNRP